MFFTPKLAWSKTQESRTLQGLKASATIFKYQKIFGSFSPRYIFKLFDTVVKPILCYGSEISGFRIVEKIETVQAIFCKRYCCPGSNTADYLALGEYGRLPLAVTYISRCLKYDNMDTIIANGRVSLSKTMLYYVKKRG